MSSPSCSGPTPTTRNRHARADRAQSRGTDRAKPAPPSPSCGNGRARRAAATAAARRDCPNRHNAAAAAARRTPARSVPLPSSDRRPPLVPLRRPFISRRDAQHRRILEIPPDELHGNRQPGARQAGHHRQRRMPGHVERRPSLPRICPLRLAASSILLEGSIELAHSKTSTSRSASSTAAITCKRRRCAPI